MNLLLLLSVVVAAVVVGSCPVWLFTRLFSLFLYSFLCCLFFRYIYLISQHCVGAGRRGTVLVRRALAYYLKFLFLDDDFKRISRCDKHSCKQIKSNSIHSSSSSSKKWPWAMLQLQLTALTPNVCSPPSPCRPHRLFAVANKLIPATRWAPI